MDKLSQLRGDAGDILADIASETRYESVLSALLKSPIGRWVTAQKLSEDQSDLQQRIEQVQRTAAQLDERADNPRLFLCWLPYPENEDYCTIMLFLDPYLWTWVAIYNRALFLRKHLEH